MKYPNTPTEELVENIFGHKVTDNYRWLEDGSKVRVKAWINAQNKLTDQILPKKLQTEIGKEVKQSYQFPAISMPYSYQGTYFWWERQPGQEQGVLYFRKGLSGKKRILIDPNKLSKAPDHIVSLDYWVPSKSGKLLAYGTSENGNELSVLKVLEVETGKTLETVAKNASWSSIAWLPDESGFYYTNHPEVGTVPKGEERYHQKVLFHTLDTDPTADPEIFGKGRPKEDTMSLRLSVDGKLLIISVSQNWERNDLYFYNADSKKVTELIVGYDAQSWIAFGNRLALLCTNYQAPNNRMLRADPGKMPCKLELWQEFIPERKHKLEWFSITKEQILAAYLIDASQKALTFDLNGKETGQLPIPEHASLLGISARKEEAEYFYEYASFVTPGVTYRYNPTTRKLVKFNQMESMLNESDYLVKQEWFKSKDGTKVPMFIVHRKDLKLNGKNPTILYGYGGFETSITPGFLRSFGPWLKRGGVYASANIRGGGEFGKAWHIDAVRKNKQKSYDDFIAAAEHLTTNKYTSNQHLGILGGSNGGLLVCVAAVQRPDLFKAVVSEVPLTDMVRFPKFLIAGRWVSEYGDPSKPEDLKYILKFSPYHNAKAGTEYPSFLFLTADNDTRVDPMHSRKMTALFQSINTKNAVLLYTDNSSGHRGSLTMSRYYRDEGKILAFFMEQLGIIVQ